MKEINLACDTIAEHFYNFVLERVKYVVCTAKRNGCQRAYAYDNVLCLIEELSE